MTYSVYGLFDPQNRELKYVGYSCQKLKNRLNQHCRPSKLKSNSYKNNWIKSLQQIGLVPEISLLEQYECEEDALAAEVDLISYYRYIGCQLTNVTKGGDKGVNYIRDEKIKQKISKSSLGRKHTQKTKSKISNSLKGIKRHHTLEHRQKISKTLAGRPGRPISEDNKNKLRAANLGRKTAEESKIKSIQNNKSYKLTQKDIINIKTLYQTNKYTYKGLSELFAISPSHVFRIINNQSGKYLP